jgi:hypothetical protein
VTERDLTLNTNPPPLPFTVGAILAALEQQGYRLAPGIGYFIDRAEKRCNAVTGIAMALDSALMHPADSDSKPFFCLKVFSTVRALIGAQAFWAVVSGFECTQVRDADEAALSADLLPYFRFGRELRAIALMRQEGAERSGIEIERTDPGPDPDPEEIR